MVRGSDYSAELEQKSVGNQLDTQKYKKINEVWFYKGRVLLDSQFPICRQIISEHHDTPSGGYSDYHRTLHRVKRTFWWKGMKTDIKKAIRECDVCQRHKHELVKPSSLLDLLSVPASVRDEISMDFIQGLPVSNGKSTIFVVVDRFSKYAHFIVLKHPINAS